MQESKINLDIENYKIYTKVKHQYENEHIEGLEQKGPKSLNYVNRKTEFFRILKDNQKLKGFINNATSEYSVHSKKMVSH